jgi:hypothetical protein
MRRVQRYADDMDRKGVDKFKRTVDHNAPKLEKTPWLN